MEQLTLEPEVSEISKGYPPWFNAAVYSRTLNSDPDFLAGYPNLDPVGAAVEKSFLLFTAMDNALPERAGFVINSSTGKDSTLMTALLLLAQQRWLQAGRTLRPVLILISDTNSEFPEMALRMRAEVAALTAYAGRAKLPMSIQLVQPPPKHRLLVELIGNGKPLPKLVSGKSRNGYEASSWCMSRVKAGVLDKAIKVARETFPYFVQCLGVRSAESAKRNQTIQRYSVKDIPAVSQLGQDSSRLGFCPIAHWTDHELRDWITDAQACPEQETPWRPEGIAELVEIYTKGAGNKSENPYECALTITKDGNVSNSCSDLTGTRMGCWMCMLSKNASLSNMAHKDPRYQWLQKCHRLIFTHHARNQRRVQLRNASGFNVETLFPKSFTFSERYRILVYVFRAELESGFPLLSSEDLGAITLFWEKHGVFTVTVEEARQDALNWKATGKLEFTYQKNIRFVEVLARDFSEGIPAGAFFKSEILEGLNLAHLISLSATGFGSPIVPTLLAYVLADRRETNRMVTDLPSIIGARTNTGLLNGMLGAAWECIQVRSPTEWELEMSDGRIFFYTTSTAEELKQIQKELSKDVPETRALTRYYENTRALSRGCPEDPFAESVLLGCDIPQLSQLDLDKSLSLSAELAYLSDELSSRLQGLSRKALKTTVAHLDLLESPEGKIFRKEFKQDLAKVLDLDKHKPLFVAYSRVLRQILQMIREEKTTCAVISRCAYIARCDIIDPEYARQLWNELISGSVLGAQHRTQELPTVKRLAVKRLVHEEPGEDACRFSSELEVGILQRDE